MWLSRKLTGLLLGAVLVLAGCGYSPALVPGGVGEAPRLAVAVSPPVDKNSFDLVKQLEQRLGRPEAPRYRLSYEIDTVQDGVGVTPEQEIIRYNIFGKVTFSLMDIENGEVVLSGSVDTFTGYSVGSVDATAVPPSTSATISTLAAERDALSRLMTALADQIVTRLIAQADNLQQ